MYTVLMVKMVSLSEDAYALLSLHKKKDMSFSRIILAEFRGRKKTKTKQDLLNYINSIPKGKEGNISGKIDEILYGR
jgi:predicted CopG family antitoxin